MRCSLFLWGRNFRRSHASTLQQLVLDSTNFGEDFWILLERRFDVANRFANKRHVLTDFVPDLEYQLATSTKRTENQCALLLLQSYESPPDSAFPVTVHDGPQVQHPCSPRGRGNYVFQNPS